MHGIGATESHASRMRSKPELLYARCKHIVLIDMAMVSPGQAPVAAMGIFPGGYTYSSYDAADIHLNPPTCCHTYTNKYFVPERHDRTWICHARGSAIVCIRGKRAVRSYTFRMFVSYNSAHGNFCFRQTFNVLMLCINNAAL
jgi:hypothetical protein